MPDAPRTIEEAFANLDAALFAMRSPVWFPKREAELATTSKQSPTLPSPKEVLTTTGETAQEIPTLKLAKDWEAGTLSGPFTQGFSPTIWLARYVALSTLKKGVSNRIAPLFRVPLLRIDARILQRDSDFYFRAIGRGEPLKPYRVEFSVYFVSDMHNPIKPYPDSISPLNADSLDHAKKLANRAMFEFCVRNGILLNT